MVETIKQPHIFSHTFIRVILLSGIFLQIGTWVRNFAVLLYVMEITNNDPYVVSLISVAEFAPIFIFSFIGGTFADRWRPKRTMVWCDILSAISVFCVLGTLMFGSWKVIFFVTLFSAILSQFSQPSAMKLFKQHVPAEQMQAGMAMFQTLVAIFMILGPAIGTMVYQSFGITISIGVTGVAFLLSAAVLYQLPKDHQPEQNSNQTSLLQEMGDGLRYVWSKFVLRRLSICFIAVGLAVGLIQPLGIFVVVEQLGLPKENLQWLFTTTGVAMLLGGALVMTLSKKISPQKLLALGLLSSAFSVFGISFTQSFWVVLIFQFVNGLFFPCIQIGINTMILFSSEQKFVGRVNGVLSPLFSGMMVVTMSLAGVVKESVSLQASYQIAGLLFVTAVCVVIPLFKMQLQKQTDTRESLAEQEEIVDSQP
ncbi:MFS transporter [Brevibacillus laterosporus]|uniref:MFS transporter n=1 Tax=Brevibacillus laterosporus TaxID=1465 RepID=UPI00039B17D0|nr:MFS transporter [Brevibacillus laterosporus]ATO50020.1 MFS transporter [Brevibacillus laterosporus DSM 25]MBG9803040.1 MFS transporter [Brevibacillus laterosporus]MED2005945.1 MFS transporter [Brevibacillus laterosporus]MED4762952.1 MFS transporter [Brevibacillus laterosporus]